VANNILFLLFNLGIFWVIYWAWKQDNKNETAEDAAAKKNASSR